MEKLSVAGYIFILLSIVARPATTNNANAVDNKSCGLPPSLWCSSMEAALKCKTVEQCYQWMIKDAAPVSIALYYEALCPACMEFITTQLWPTMQSVGSIMNVTMVPYGNAQESQLPNGTWEFTCQHGPQECQGNLIESCVIHHFGYNATAYMPFIYCFESSNPDSSTAKKCSKQLGINYNEIESCTNSELGNKLMHQMGLLTEALNPPHEYTPWITMNGVWSDETQQAAQIDLKSLVCNTYKGPKPVACGTKKLQKCYRKKRI